MTIEETIKKYEKAAEEKEKQAIWLWSKEGNPNYENCIKVVKELRQLAEWLRELKKWRTLKDSINMLCDVDCEYPQYRESGTMCDACPIGTVIEYFEQIFCGEVNANEVGFQDNKKK